MGMTLCTDLCCAGSGGSGGYHGGDGVVRDIEFLRPLTAGILSERRAVEPFGLLGGGPGQRGLNLLLRRGGRVVNLGGKATVRVEAGGALGLRVQAAGR
jgi:5-oxoprolinase (ATP-hydrolysing)